MFIEFILRMIENILLAYFLGYFLNVENKKDYVLKLSLLGTIFSFFHFSTFFYLGSLFLMHFIFLEYIQKQNVHTIKMIYGQSMGAEIAIELFKQLEKTNISVEYCFLDGTPCIKLPYLYKKFMYFKFNQILKMMKKKDVDQILNMKLIKKIARGNIENLRPMIEPMAVTAQFLSKESVKNETECCYTFDFPLFDKETQNKMYFFYGKEEKAYKTCYRGVKKAYPQSNSIFKEGDGHLMYFNVFY